MNQNDYDNDEDIPPVTAKKKRRLEEGRPCERDNGQMHLQKWVGVTTWHGQTYHRWRCSCSAAKRPHINRLLNVTVSNSKYIGKEASVCAMSGRTIFGQVIRGHQ